MTASEEAENAFAMASVHSSNQEQGKAATLFLTLGHFLPCVDTCCGTWKTDICLCGSKVSICSSCHAPDSSISGIATLTRAAWWKVLLGTDVSWGRSLEVVHWHQDFAQLVSFGVAKEAVLSMKHLCWDTANTSHVHSYCVCGLQKNFRSREPGQPQGWGPSGSYRFWIGWSQPAWLPYYLSAECPLTSGLGDWYSLHEANLGSL